MKGVISFWLTPSLVGALVWVLVPAPATGNVGGAAAADPAQARAVVMVASADGGCSGVAIAPDLVLTAAHCVRSGPTGVISVPGEAQSKKAWALEVFRHRNYGEVPQIGADLALLKLAVEITPSPAVLSAKDAVQIADHFVIIGFGRTDLSVSGPAGAPRSATLVLQSGIPNTRRLILADPATYGKTSGLGACNGDSGGPVFEGTSGRLALIGIMTSGKCGLSTVALVLEPYLQWIFDTASDRGIDGGSALSSPVRADRVGWAKRGRGAGAWVR
jgi:hypothetical protein